VQNASTFTTSAPGEDLRDTTNVTGTYTFSVFVKRVDVGGVRLRIDAATDANAYFDLSDGSVFVSSGIIDADAIDYGNNWWRVYMTANVTNTQKIQIFTTDGTQSYANGSVYLYGAQLEAGSYSTSYIPNHGTSGGVTRAADSGVSDVDSLLTSNATYTWFVEFIVPDSGIGGGEITLKDAGGSSQLRIYCNQNNTIGLRVEDGGQTHLINVSVGDTAKCLFQCSNGLVKGFYNGLLVHTFSIDTGMDAQKIHLGPPISAPNVKQVMLFNEALTDAECITLTTL
jgi:hypothetical protein